MSLARKILAWLQADFPAGVLQQDYYPLLAFLGRSLKPEAVSQVVTALHAEREPGKATTVEEVRAAIEEVTNSPAPRQNEARIERRLGELGWELEPAGDRSRSR